MQTIEVRDVRRTEFVISQTTKFQQCIFSERPAPEQSHSTVLIELSVTSLHCLGCKVIVVM